MLSHFSGVCLFATLWTVACQPPLCMRFSRQEYWSGVLWGIFLNQGSNPCLLHLLHCMWILYPLSHLGSPILYIIVCMCQSQFPSLSPPPLPARNHKFVFYICDATSLFPFFVVVEFYLMAQLYHSLFNYFPSKRYLDCF